MTMAALLLSRARDNTRSMRSPRSPRPCGQTSVPVASSSGDGSPSHATTTRAHAQDLARANVSAKNAAASPAASAAVREADSRVLTKPGSGGFTKMQRVAFVSIALPSSSSPGEQSAEEAKHARCQPGSLVRVSEALPHLGLGRIGVNRPR